MSSEKSVLQKGEVACPYSHNQKKMALIFELSSMVLHKKLP